MLLGAKFRSKSNLKSDWQSGRVVVNYCGVEEKDEKKCLEGGKSVVYVIDLN